ncbi:hypothetical protein IscW_ISCW021043 [Ixodes scapularis]|uniref:Secreted protein n=1 Tax=Ixodes scapularis TaxID=6945 RepID=B7Q9W7_IXOSC|nr:hypothetical protein IscW_ISCW021043 [Ixodes scapularis]|eukprot:XP_002406389.1 hypothetical protein IscW_ISCW021043 [Ixodes scapularis]
MECPLVLLAFLGYRLFLVGFENHVSGPRRCKSCALTTSSPRNVLCYQILALQIFDRALHGSVIELPDFVSIEEAMVRRNLHADPSHFFLSALFYEFFNSCLCVLHRLRAPGRWCFLFPCMVTPL